MFYMLLMHSEGDNRQTIKLVIKLNVDPFSKTVKTYVFELCMIVTSHEYYKYTLILVTFDLFIGHKISIT